MGSQRGSASVTPSQRTRAVSGFGKGRVGKTINLSLLASRRSSWKKSGRSKSKQVK